MGKTGNVGGFLNRGNRSINPGNEGGGAVTEAGLNSLGGGGRKSTTPPHWLWLAGFSTSLATSLVLLLLQERSEDFQKNVLKHLGTQSH